MKLNKDKYVTHCQPFCNMTALCILLTFLVIVNFSDSCVNFILVDRICLYCTYSIFIKANGSCPLQPTPISKGCLTHFVVQCGRTVIPIPVKRVVVKRRKGWVGVILTIQFRRSSFWLLSGVIHRMQNNRYQPLLVYEWRTFLRVWV